MKTLGCFLICLMLFTIPAIAGNGKDRKYSINGHIQDLQMEWIQDYKGSWQSMNTISNRLDLRWYPKSWFRAHAGMRNIMNYGGLVEYSNILSKNPLFNTPSFHDIMVQDEGYFDLTFSIADERSFFVYSTFDRANVQFTRKNFVVTMGRQRINWSVNLVWTPNDIFNTFNYFNFDYAERPGCDAVLLQYYTGATSSLQLAGKIDHNEEITAAALYKFLLWNYDFQFLAGTMTEDAVFGFGWSGQIKGAGFNGEMSYFRDINNFSDTTGQLVASAGINYTLNKWYFQVSGLLNTSGTSGPASMGNFIEFNSNITARNFTLARYSAFGQVSYQVTPLIKADLSAIYNPDDKSVFVGPSIDFSLTNNIGFLATSQIFMGNDGTEFGDYGSIYYLRLKYSF